MANPQMATRDKAFELVLGITYFRIEVQDGFREGCACTGIV
jgi:hypothetical protein